MIDWYANLVTRHRAVVACILIAITGVAAWGYVYDPPPETSERNRRSNQGIRWEVSSVLEQNRTDCFLVITTEGLFVGETIAVLRSIVAAVDELPYVERLIWVDRVPTLNAFGLAQPLLPDEDASAEQIEEAKRRVREHPLVLGQLLSEDMKTLLMPVSFDWLQVESDEDCSTRLLETARSVAGEEGSTRVEVELTGNVPLYIAHRRAFKANQRKFQAIAYGMVFGLAALLFRGIRAVLIVACAPALGIFWTLGVLNLLDELTNPLTNVVLPVLLTMVGFTDGVHLMVHIRRVRDAGMDRFEASRSAIQQVGLACALTSLTTTIGFVSLMVARSEYVQGFGRACAIGVVLSFVAVVTFIPLVCTTRFARNIQQGADADLVGRKLESLGGVIDWILDHARAVSAVGIALTFGLALIAITLRADDRRANAQPAGSAEYQALERCDEAFGGIELLHVVLEWTPDTPEDSIDKLQAIRDVEQILRDEELVHHPLSIRSILTAFPTATDDRMRMSFLHLLPESIRSAYYRPEENRALVTARIQDLGIARYEPVFEHIESQLAGLEQRYSGFTFALTGDPIRRSESLFAIIRDLVASLGTASIIIFVVMALVYRSLRTGLITVVPNMFPLVVTASMLVLTGQPMEMASVCAFTVCLGIAVDDTIHFLTRYQQERQVNADKRVAIQRTFVGVGTALVITTLITVAGFSTVLTSDLQGHRMFAAMACSTLAAALLGDLVFLPAMLVLFERREDDAAAETAEGSEEARTSRSLPLTPSPSSQTSLGRGERDSRA